MAGRKGRGRQEGEYRKGKGAALVRYWTCRMGGRGQRGYEGVAGGKGDGGWGRDQRGEATSFVFLNLCLNSVGFSLDPLRLPLPQCLCCSDKLSEGWRCRWRCLGPLRTVTLIIVTDSDLQDHQGNCSLLQTSLESLMVSPPRCK